MKIESYEQSRIFAKLESIKTHVQHRAVKTVYRTAEDKAISCWTVVIERREGK